MERARIFYFMRPTLIVSASIVAPTLMSVSCGKPETAPTSDVKTTKPGPVVTPDKPKPKPALALASVDIGSSSVPHDLSTAKPNQAQLSQFAWQEFVALNWPASYTSASPTRGQPDPGATFASVTSKTTRPLVWQTYKHRVEVFPQDLSGYIVNFDEPPVYAYGGTPGHDVLPCTATGVDPAGVPLSQFNSTHGHRDIFNNLDETTEINLCSMYVDGDPSAPSPLGPYMEDPNGRRFIYEAKANRDMFEYIVGASFFEPDKRWTSANFTFRAVRVSEAGGVAPCPPNNSPTPLICFPPGVQGGAEGSIEIKATWRQLTQTEYDSGRYLVASVIRYFNYQAGDQDEVCYDVVADHPTDHSLPYGLAGLHIIHKTTNIPTYVFATFEQVDNLDQSKPDNALFYFNRNAGIVNPDKQVVTSRAHPMQQATEDVNSRVHAQIIAANPESVWQYYKLIGVQGPAANFSNDNDFFLANIVTETNEPLRSFSGSLDNGNGTINPQSINLHKGDETFIGGGCKGCHGNAQTGIPRPGTDGQPPENVGSYDFSFITANAPFDGVPDAVNQPLLKSTAAWYAGTQH